MLINESIWLGKCASKIPEQSLSPLLNIGSQSADFAGMTPWIYSNFLGPLKSRGVKIVNTDLIASEGVDLVGDLLDEKFVSEIREMGFKSVVCTNLLEHVADPALVARNISKTVPVGGYIFVSCPRRFPYHPDPIDNGFRPDPKELVSHFPCTQVVESGIVECETGWEHLGQGGKSRARKLCRLALPFIRPKGWMDTARTLAWSFRKFSATCAILVRI